MVHSAPNLMDRKRVRLSLIFKDGHLEKSFRRSLSSTRTTEDILAYILAIVLFTEVYLQGAYGTTIGNALW